MKIGCWEIVKSKQIKGSANLCWKGRYVGTIWGDDSGTQVLTLNDVEVKLTGDRAEIYLKPEVQR